MNILITSGANPLAQWLASALSHEHTIRVTERTLIACDQEFVQSPLDHDAGTNLLVRGMDAILHVAEPLPHETENQQIDYLTRGTYNLLWAATAEAVPHVVFFSTLHLMTQYDADLFVQEHWRPRPSCDPHVLGKYLGECVCREFAREHKVRVTVLRLGDVVRAEEVAGQPFNPLWVDERDVLQAVRLALTTDSGLWAIYHIGSGAPHARFRITRAQNELGYEPAFNFASPS